jgi:CheY-like chemotaxis protein
MKRQKWILLAEDNNNDADLVVRALAANQQGEQVVVAHDGVEAIDCLYRRGQFQSRAAPGHPAVVLLDLKMPRMDGLEVLRQIKDDDRLRAIPVVTFTSSREQSDVELSYHLGANAYVVKPVEFSEFISVLNEIRTFWLAVNEPPPDEAPDSSQPELTPI